MNYTLESLHYRDVMREYSIIHAIVESNFHACDALHKENLVDTGRPPMHEDLASTDYLRSETRQDYVL